ncbi:MAG: malate dehydrogenase [Candidatus Omnitrophota bacterium]
MKISVIGAGNVGGFAAARIAADNIGDVFLIDIAPKLARAKAFDMDDSRSLLNHDRSVTGSEDLRDIKGSDIIVVTAGLARKPGMTREDLLIKNCAIIEGISSHIRDLAPDAIVVVVTNPLDVMTYFMFKKLNFDRSRVFGMGITLDAARFANLIGKELAHPVTGINACVIGSHGEKMLPLPRLSTVDKKPLAQVATLETIASLVDRTINRGKEIVSLYGTGSAYFAPSAAISQLVRIIARDERIPVGVSAYLNGEYGLADICIGVPCIIGKSGIERIIDLGLTQAEQEQFAASADSIRQLIGHLTP